MPIHDDNEKDPKPVTEKSAESVVNKLSDTELRTLYLASLRPKPLGKAKNKPYYRQTYALEFREVFEEFMADKARRIYYYKDFPKYSNNTLYLKIMQSREYLLDNLDPEGKYNLFDQCTYIHKKKGVGVIMEVLLDVLDQQLSVADNTTLITSEFKPQKLNSNGDWRDRLDKFLEGEPKYDEQFVADKIALGEEEQRQLEIELCQLDNIAYNISCSKVTVNFLKDKVGI